MINYKEKLQSLTNEITAIEGVYTANFSQRIVLNNNTNKVDFSFPSSLLNYLKLGPRLSMIFQFNKSNKHIFGRNMMLFTEEMSAEIKRIQKRFSFLNKSFLKQEGSFIFSELGYLHFVILEIIDGNWDLYLMLPDGSRYLMQITIEEYIDFLLLTRSMYLGEAYLCPDFPKTYLQENYDGFYENMELLFDITPDQLPMCCHKEVVKNAVPVYEQYGKSFFDEFKRLFEDEIEEGKCTISPNLSNIKTDRVNPIWSMTAIELNIGTRLPKSYRQLHYDFGNKDISFFRKTDDNRTVSITFFKAILNVFWNKEEKDFTYDANWFLYGEKGKVPDFNGIYLFAISGENKFGMYVKEENNIEIVMVDSVENIRLVQLPENIRTMDGFMNRFLETKGEFLLDEIPI